MQNYPTVEVTTAQGKITVSNITFGSYQNLSLSSLRYIDDGAEGYVYEIPGMNKVVKILFKASEKITSIEYLLQANLAFNIIKPQDLVYSQGKFVGYTMQKITKRETFLNFAATQPISLSTYQLVRGLCTGVRRIHECSFVLCDFNETNILITKEIGLTFIDTDGWQSPFRKGQGAAPDINLADPFLDRHNFSQGNDWYSVYALLYLYLTKVPQFRVNAKSNNVIDRVKHKWTTLAMPEKIDRNAKYSHQFLIKSLPKSLYRRFDEVFHGTLRPPIDDKFLDQVEKYIASAKSYPLLAQAFALQQVPVQDPAPPASTKPQNKVNTGGGNSSTQPSAFQSLQQLQNRAKTKSTGQANNNTASARPKPKPTSAKSSSGYTSGNSSSGSAPSGSSNWGWLWKVGGFLVFCAIFNSCFAYREQQAARRVRARNQAAQPTQIAPASSVSAIPNEGKYLQAYRQSRAQISRRQKALTDITTEQHQKLALRSCQLMAEYDGYFYKALDAEYAKPNVVQLTGSKHHLASIMALGVAYSCPEYNLGTRLRPEFKK